MTNAQQGTIVKNVEFVHAYRKSPDFDRVTHTPLFDSVRQWDIDYALWLNDDHTITAVADELAADPFVLADINKYGLTTKTGKFLGMRAMDRLLAVSEAANAFVLANLDRIARRDIPPVSCKEIDAPTRGWVEVEADHRTYILTRLRSGTLNQVYSLARNYRLSDDYQPKYGRTVIRGDLWKGFYQDMGNVAKEGGIAFNNGKKPIRLVSQLIKWANNSPDAIVLDFFAGSGTTTHAVMTMNAADGGRRQSIVVTNNEVAEKDAKALRRDGVFPGDELWEAQGVFQAVARPRIETVVTGVRPDGTEYSDGMSENVTFVDLTYTDRDDVERGKAFAHIAPMLWACAGGKGAIIERSDQMGFSAPADATYAVLFDTAAAGPFLEAVSDRKDITAAFVVTDSLEAYRAVVDRLRVDIRKVRLYENYLTTFTINAGRSVS